jgi:hypothetical protein
MLSAHYKGTIDISNYWSAGAIRTVSISAIASGTTGEAQSAQTIELVIIGTNHDTLSTKNGTRTTAAITVQTANSLTTKGYMNTSCSGPSYGLWSTCPRRTWCNNKFKAALPSYIQNLIKPVTKYTNRYCNSAYSGYSSYRTQDNTTDNCFLLTSWELFGKQTAASGSYGSMSADGTQYEYMKFLRNRIKYLGTTGTKATEYWRRDASVNESGTARFGCCDNLGDYDVNDANGTYGIAPAFCL